MENAGSRHSVSCPACGGAGHDVVEVCGAYSILDCKACRLSFADPMRAPDPDYYKEHIVYRPVDAQTVDRHCRSAAKESNRRLLDMVSRNGTGRKVLDVGCGYGAFVHFAVRQGFDAHGMDFNGAQIRAGKSILGLGDRLTCGDIQELRGRAGAGGEFDLVTMFEVIEHVEDPKKLLQDVARLLKPGGLVAISCPNEDRWQPAGRIFVDFPPHHLTRWRPETMRRFLASQGLSHVQTEVESSFRDLLWVAYVNRSAKKKLSKGESIPPRGESFSVTSLRKIKMAAFDFLKWMFFPFDVLLKYARIGTMGMRVIARKG